jgi:hypothetical protein
MKKYWMFMVPLLVISISFSFSLTIGGSLVDDLFFAPPGYKGIEVSDLGGIQEGDLFSFNAAYSSGQTSKVIATTEKVEDEAVVIHVVGVDGEISLPLGQEVSFDMDLDGTTDFEMVVDSIEDDSAHLVLYTFKPFNPGLFGKHTSRCVLFVTLVTFILCGYFLYKRK